MLPTIVHRLPAVGVPVKSIDVRQDRGAFSVERDLDVGQMVAGGQKGFQYAGQPLLDGLASATLAPIDAQPVLREASRGARGILGVDPLRIAGHEFVDRQLVDPRLRIAGCGHRFLRSLAGEPRQDHK